MSYRVEIAAEIGEQIINDNNLRELSESAKDSKDMRFTIAEVGNCEDETLTFNNLVLVNREEDQAGSESRRISLAESIPNFFLFEGEIIGLEGKAESKQYVAEKIYKPKPVPKTKIESNGNVDLYAIILVGRKRLYNYNSSCRTFY